NYRYPWDALWQYLGGGEEEPMTIDITTPHVGDYFTGSADVWQCKKNNLLVGHGLLDFYKKFGGDALCGLTYMGLPTTNEISVASHPGVVFQRYERAIAVYDPGHVLDNPPGSGPVYTAHLDDVRFGSKP